MAAPPYEGGVERVPLAARGVRSMGVAAGTPSYPSRDRVSTTLVRRPFMPFSL